mgnify:CR=1 FL=1
MQFTNSDHLQFVQDMQAVNLEPFFYRGRWYWRGPAVEVDNLQDALGNTTVRCQWETLGLGFVVYPVATDSNLD